MDIQTTASERGQPKCKTLVKAINFHAGRLIPFVHKDGCDMPKTFVTQVKEALHFGDLCLGKSMMTDVEEDHFAHLVKAAWTEWTSPPSATLHSQRKIPFVDSLDENLYDKLHDELFDQWRELIAGNEWGELEENQDLRAFVKTVKFHTRRHIHITYKDSRDIPSASTKKVIAAVTVYFVIHEVDEDNISDMVKDAWRGIKNELRRKYVRNKDPITVKASSPSPFVSKEDWLQFVDMCTSTVSQGLCTQSATNRGKENFQSTQGTAKKRDLNCDEDLDLTEVDIRSHTTTKKRKTVKSAQEKNQRTVSSDVKLSKIRENYTPS